VHGATIGIQFSSGEVLSWTNLRPMLVPIKMRALEGISFSACLLVEGTSACQMAMQVGMPHIIISQWLAISKNQLGQTQPSPTQPSIIFFQRDTISSACSSSRDPAGVTDGRGQSSCSSGGKSIKS